jgi:hypothetical protein
VKFVHEVTGWTTGPRLISNFENLFGGDGLGVTIGQMPSVSHFPTSISDPQMVALPHNILYDVTSPSIAADVIPEPSTFVMGTGLILMGLVACGWRRLRRRR